MGDVNNNNQVLNTDDLKSKISKVDFSKVPQFGYKELQELASKYLASDDPEYQAFGQELSSVSQDEFGLSQAEQTAKRIHSYLLKAGLSVEKADEFGIQMLTAANHATISMIIEAMNDESYQEWEKLNEYSPNILQQLFVLNETAKLLLDRSFDDIYDEQLTKAVNTAISILSNAQENADLLHGLTDEQADLVMIAFNSGEYETAIQLIYNFAQENGSK